MPQLYTVSANNHLKEDIQKLESRIQGAEWAEFEDILNQFCESGNAKVQITDENGQPVPTYGIREEYLLTEEGFQTFNNADYDKTKGMWIAREESEIYSFQAELSDGTVCYITVTASNFGKLEVLFEDIKGVLPVILIFIILLSFGVSILYTRFVTKPVLKTAAAAKAMAEMNWQEARISVDRKDEIGSLAHNINATSKKLEETLKERDKANRFLQRELQHQMRLDEERKEFFSAASHELKTPVTILKGQITGMLYRVGVYSDRELYLKKALNTTVEMERRIAKILDVSKFENSDVVAHFEDTNLYQNIRRELEMCEDLMNDKGIELSVKIPKDLYVYADPKMLSKALENILHNAVKYSPHYAKIGIWTLVKGNKQILRIENTGVWLPEGKEEELFQPFYRGEESRNMKTGGTGLGLYIVKKVLDLQNISYKIENTSKGVIFEICFKNIANFR